MQTFRLHSEHQCQRQDRSDCREFISSFPHIQIQSRLAIPRQHWVVTQNHILPVLREPARAGQPEHKVPNKKADLAVGL